MLKSGSDAISKWGSLIQMEPNQNSHMTCVMQEDELDEYTAYVQS